MRGFLFTCLVICCFAHNSSFGQSIKFEGFDFGYSNHRMSIKQQNYHEFYTQSRHSTTLPDTGMYLNQIDKKPLANRGLHFRFHWAINDGTDEQLNRHKLKLSFKNGFIDDDILHLEPLNADTPANHPSYRMLFKDGNFGIGFEYAYTFFHRKRLQLLGGVALASDFSISRKLTMSSLAIGSDTTDGAFQHTYFLDQNPAWGIRPYLAAEIPLRKMTSFYFRYHYGFTRYNLEGLKQTTSYKGWQFGLKFNI